MILCRINAQVNVRPVISNSIPHYLTCYTVQIGWIKQALLIFCGINIKIGTDSSSTDPPLFMFPTVTHITKELLVCLFILFS